MDTPQIQDKKITIARALMLGALFLLPLIFVSANVLSLGATKVVVLAVATTIALILWALTRMRVPGETPSVYTPLKYTAVFSALIFLVAYTVSAALSVSFVHSALGSGFERDTLLAFVLFFSTALAGAALFKQPRALSRLWQVSVASFALLALFHIARLVVGADVLLPSIFSTDPTASLLGSWNDVAVLAGVVVMMVLSGVIAGVIKRGGNAIVSYTLLVLALALLCVINLSVVWVVLTVFAALMLGSIWFKSSVEVAERRTRSIVPGIILVFGLAFSIWGSTIGGVIANTLNVQHLDVRPSIAGTWSVAKSVYADSALFGSGPSTFVTDWTLYKPEGVYLTEFWNTDFSFGIGFVPTIFITGGIFAGIALLVFVITVLIMSGVVFMRRTENPLMRYLAMSFASSTALLWVLAIVYVPGSVVLAYTFAFTGVTIALFGMQARNAEAPSQPLLRGTAVRVVLLAVAIIAAVVLLAYADKTTANVVSNRALVAANNNSLEKAERLSSFASTIDPSPQHLQVRAQVALAQARVAFDKVQNGTAEEKAAAQQNIQTYLANAVSFTQAAISAYNVDYSGYVFLGDIYANLIPLGVSGAYESAIATYEEAFSRAPEHPGIYLSEAYAAYANGDAQAAKQYTQSALETKGNYADAYYLLSNIALQENNLKDALVYTENTAVLAPNNVEVLYRLGVLQYSSGDYEKAAAVLERAVTFNPEYANALYFLGLSYDQLGEEEGELAVFTRLAELNPDNETVDAILSSLKSGGSAFDVIGAVPAPKETLPDDTTIEKTQ